MKAKVLSFSGGRSSAYFAQLFDFDEFIFCDTGGEDQETYDFIRRVASNFKLNITCIKVDINPVLGVGNGYKVVTLDEIGPDLEAWEGMIVKYGRPAINIAFCTDKMKTRPTEKYLKDKYGSDYELFLGIRYDEPRRLWGGKIYKNLRQLGVLGDDLTDLFKHVYSTGEFNLDGADDNLKKLISDRFALIHKKKLNYLANESDATKEDILSFWSSKYFDLQIDEHLGNCIFCIKKSDAKLALASLDRPQKAIEFIELTEGDKPRITGRKVQSKAMYRKRRLLSEVLAEFHGVDKEYLQQYIKNSGKLETGSCSESCEAFNID